MATNKNALIRFKVLDNCFRNTGKRYFMEDLIAECNSVLFEIDINSSGISRRQIFQDILFMESKEGWGVILDRQRDGKRIYYRYADTKFSINNMPLNEVEVNQLKSAVDILSQFKGMPQFEWINELVPKLKQGISSEEVSATIMEFDNNQYLKGIEHLGILYNAIYYRKTLCISYQPFENDSPFELILHPHFLKQYNNRWFLFGYNPETNKNDWNLAIDRVVAIKELKDNYHNSIIDWQDYFEDIIGVTKPNDCEIQNITLHFIGKTGHYMQTKPIHGSQKSKWLNSEILEVKLQLIINYELARLILSYADSVIVIEPFFLKKSIKNRLEKGFKQYDNLH